MEQWVGVVSIAFQLSGAALLLIKYCNGTAKKQLSDARKRRDHVKDETLVLGDNATDDRVIEEIWISRVALAYLVVGYIASIWASFVSIGRCKASFMVIIVSGFLVFFGKHMSSVASRPYRKTNNQSN